MTSSYQGVFKRYEKKYLLDECAYRLLSKRLSDLVEVDQYGETTICNLYYDTPDHQLIRTSLEKPVYKEKLRLRSYGIAQADTITFLELKKKFKGIVYKRRTAMPLYEAMAFLQSGSERRPAATAGLALTQNAPGQSLAARQDNSSGQAHPAAQNLSSAQTASSILTASAAHRETFMRSVSAPRSAPASQRKPSCQIEKEIDWFVHFYPHLRPAMFLSYDRIATYGKEDPSLRITFDRHITWREESLDLSRGVFGYRLLAPGQRLMEIKVSGSMPLWLSHLLDECEIYPTSFSKYGHAYLAALSQNQMLKKGANLCAS